MGRILEPEITACLQDLSACADSLGDSFKEFICKLKTGDPRVVGQVVGDLAQLIIGGKATLEGLEGLANLARKGGKTQCFIAGTLILQADQAIAIEELEVGDRVLTMTTDQVQSSETEVDPETWKKVTFDLEDRDDPELHVSLVLLRSEEWLEQFEVSKGARIPLELEEMGIAGQATVLQIEACPLAKGAGRVITGTFTRYNNDLYELTLENNELITVTGGHRIFSADRQDWQAVSTLYVGEHLRTKEAQLEIFSLQKLEGTHQVYNVEVEGDHRYFVSESEILSHNNGCGPDLIPQRRDVEGGIHSPDADFNQLQSRAANTGNPQGQWTSREAAENAARQYNLDGPAVQTTSINPGDGIVVHANVGVYPPNPNVPTTLVREGQEALLVPKDGVIHTFPIDDTHPQFGTGRN